MRNMHTLKRSFSYYIFFVFCVVVFQSLFFNQARAIKVDIQGKNVVMYLVEEVLNVPEGTIDDIIQNPDYNISMWMEFLEAAKLVSVFNRTSSR